MSKPPLIGEVDVQDLLDRLSFPEEETQQAAREQAKLFMSAATYRIKKMKTRQEADAAYDDIRLSRSLSLRQKHAGQKGFTERYINDLVDNHSSVREARDKADTAKRLEEWAKHLLDAYDHRRSTLKILAQFAFMEDNFSGGRFELERLKKAKDKLRRSLPEKEDFDG